MNISNIKRSKINRLIMLGICSLAGLTLSACGGGGSGGGSDDPTPEVEKATFSVNTALPAQTVYDNEAYTMITLSNANNQNLRINANGSAEFVKSIALTGDDGVTLTVVNGEDSNACFNDQTGQGKAINGACEIELELSKPTPDDNKSVSSYKGNIEIATNYQTLSVPITVDFVTPAYNGLAEAIVTKQASIALGKKASIVVKNTSPIVLNNVKLNIVDWLKPHVNNHIKRLAQLLPDQEVEITFDIDNNQEVSSLIAEHLNDPKSDIVKVTAANVHSGKLQNIETQLNPYNLNVTYKNDSGDPLDRLAQVEPGLYTITLSNPADAQSVVHFSNDAIDDSHLIDGVSVTEQNCTSKGALLPGGNCDLKIITTPSATNIEQMTLDVNYSLDSSSDMIYLPIELSINPSTLDLESEKVLARDNGHSETMGSLEITNKGHYQWIPPANTADYIFNNDPQNPVKAIHTTDNDNCLSHAPLNRDESCRVYFSVPHSQQDADLGMHRLTIKKNSTTDIDHHVNFYVADNNGVLTVHDENNNLIESVALAQGDDVNLKLKNIGPFPVENLDFHSGEIAGLSVSGSCTQPSYQLLPKSSCDLTIHSTFEASASDTHPTNYKISSTDLAPTDFFLPIYVHEKNDIELNNIAFSTTEPQTLTFKNNASTDGTKITLTSDPVMNLPQGVTVDANTCTQGMVLSGQQSCEIILSTTVNTKDTSSDKNITFAYSTGENEYIALAEVKINPVNVGLTHEPYVRRPSVSGEESTMEINLINNGRFNIEFPSYNAIGITYDNTPTTEVTLDTNQSLSEICTEGEILTSGDSCKLYLKASNSTPLGLYHLAVAGENFAKETQADIIPSSGYAILETNDDGYIESNIQKTLTLTNTGETKITHIELSSSNPSVLSIEEQPSSSLESGMQSEFTIKGTSSKQGSANIVAHVTDIDGNTLSYNLFSNSIRNKRNIFVTSQEVYPSYNSWMGIDNGNCNTDPKKPNNKNYKALVSLSRESALSRTGINRNSSELILYLDKDGKTLGTNKTIFTSQQENYLDNTSYKVWLGSTSVSNVASDSKYNCVNFSQSHSSFYSYIAYLSSKTLTPKWTNGQWMTQSCGNMNYARFICVQTENNN